MKQYKFLILLIVITISSFGQSQITVGYAQKYAYVRDDDMYINVRNKPNAQAKVIDTLYNLQIVKIYTDEKEMNGWVLLDLGNHDDGYIHKSRLRDIPAEYTTSLDSIWGEIWNGYDYVNCASFYVTSVDCLEIVAIVCPNNDGHFTQIEEYNDKWYRGRYRAITAPLDGLNIRNLKTGKILENFDIFDPISIIFYPSKLIFTSADFMYSYYRNRNNKTCRGLTFLNTNDILTMSFQEQTDVLVVARKAYETTKHLNAQDQNEAYEIHDQIEKIIGLNNFEYWTKLEWLYFNGNVEAQKLYPYLLPYFPKDGEGSNVIDDYLDRKWAFENRGEVIIE